MIYPLASEPNSGLNRIEYHQAWCVTLLKLLQYWFLVSPSLHAGQTKISKISNRLPSDDVIRLGQNNACDGGELQIIVQRRYGPITYIFSGSSKKILKC